MRALYGIILTSTNLSIKNQHQIQKIRKMKIINIFIEQIQWAREQILQKYRETIPDLLPIIESAIQSLTL